MDDRARETASQIVKALNKSLDETAPAEFRELGGVQLGNGAIPKIAAAISAYGDERERVALKRAARTAESFFSAHDKRLITGVHIADAIRSLIKTANEGDAL